MRATVEAETVSVAGEIVGDVRAGRLVEVHAGGRVRGDITAPEVNVDQGGEVAGSVQRTGGQPASAAAPPPIRAAKLGRHARATVRHRRKRA